MKLNLCKCGKMPTIVSPDVAEIPVYYAICKCGRRTHWRLTKEDVAVDWNKLYGVEQPPKQSTHAMNVLARKKGELAYAG
jgi:hypothetical protein